MSIEVNINLKTVNGESLIGTGNIVVGGGLTIGTTAITSGVNNRILFQSAGVVQQSSNLSFSGTELSVGNSIKVLSTGLYPALNFENSIAQKAGMQMYANQLYFTSGAAATQTAILDTVGLKIGTGASAAARLDVLAQGALSTDLAFRVRNSANTANLGQINGDGTFRFGDANGGLNNSVSYISDGRLFLSKSGANFIELNPGTTANRLYGGSNGWEISGSAKTSISTTGLTAYFYDGTLQIASGLNVSGGATNTIHIQNGVAPTTSIADQFKMYSADIVAGNAAPHFRTEMGDVIKLYKQSSAGISTVSDIVTVLTNLGLLG